MRRTNPVYGSMGTISVKWSLVPKLVITVACLATFSCSLFGAVTITNSPPDGAQNVPYPNFQFTATGGSGTYNWRWFAQDAPGGALPPGLSLSGTGVLSGTPTAAGNYGVTVQATDSQNVDNFGQANFTITISACTINFITPTELTAGDVNVPYSQAINISASSCKPPYSYSASGVGPFNSGALPPGLGLANPPAGTTSALISGTPTTSNANPYFFNITVADANNVSFTSEFSITVNPQLSFGAASPLPPATVGQAYSQSLMPTGGTTPYHSVTWDTPPPDLTLDSTGLIQGKPKPQDIGKYQFTATVTDNILGQAQKTFQLSIAAAQPLLQISPQSLNFSAVTGGSAPAPQAIAIGLATAASSTFTIFVDGGQLNTNPSFSLAVTPTKGTAPAQLQVNVDQGTLPPGSSSARIRILDQNGSEADVTVNLTVAAGNSQLQAIPPVLRFSARSQSPGTLEEDIALSNSGGGGPIGFSAAVLNGSSWISITPASGQTVRNSAVFVRVLVNTQGLGVGSHSDTVRFTYSGGTVDVPVFLFVANGGAILGVNVTGLRYQAQQGGGFVGESVKILNLGDPSTTINWTAKLVSGSDTVSLGATSGTATTAKPGQLPVNLAANATQLAAGAHYALISISDPNALNSPVYVVVVLDLAAAGSTALPDPNPGGLFFVVAAGGAVSAAQNIAVNTSSAQAVPFQVAASTADGGNWLVVSPSAGQSSGQTPGTFAVSVNPANMIPGVYSGQAAVSMNGAVRIVNITVIVLPAGSTVPSARPDRDESLSQTLPAPRAVTCTPSKLALTETGLVNNFSVPAKWPATLIVQLNDDCANPVATGAVVASFSNGDSPVSLLSNGQGASYSATWQPSSASSQMVVTLNATSGTLAPATTQLLGGVAANQAAAPVLASGGTVNAFYRVSHGPLSPGTIVEMYGSGLASSPTGTGAPPLPLNFNGTSVLVGGLSAPLFYLSDGQLDVQIPNELPANQQFPILVSANGAVTLPDQVDIVPLQPTVDALTGGTLVAQHGADSSLVTSSSPAKPGEPLVIYLLGMGPTNPAVASGQAAPSSPPLAQVTNQPTIKVDGENAQVFFAGLTPGFAGLYQIDFYVPSDARSGNLTVTISQNGVLTNTTTLPVSQ